MKPLGSFSFFMRGSSITQNCLCCVLPHTMSGNNSKTGARHVGMLDVALIPTAGSSSGIFVIDIHTGAIVRQLKVSTLNPPMLQCQSRSQDSTSTTVVPTADGYICAAQSNKGLLHYWKIADGIDDDDDDATLRGMASNPCYKCSTPEVTVRS